MELLVIVSAIGIWCFDNWTDFLEKGASWLRPITEGWIAFVNMSEPRIHREFRKKTWTPAYQFHSLKSDDEYPANRRLRNSA